jgi:Cdc6-like AAA superfamily ATPase
LKIEREEDRKSYQELTQKLSASARRSNGISWYPVAIRGTEMSRGDYVTVELERTTNQEIAHQFRFGSSAMFFSNHNPVKIELRAQSPIKAGILSKSLYAPTSFPIGPAMANWVSICYLMITAMKKCRNALKLAVSLYDKKDEPELIKILIGEKKPSFEKSNFSAWLAPFKFLSKRSGWKILSAEEIAIVHGPPGTGKTTTLVQAIKALIQQDNEKNTGSGTSNTAVDLLSEKLSEERTERTSGRQSVRVSEKLMSLTLDFKMSEHSSMKAIKKTQETGFSIPGYGPEV